MKQHTCSLVVICFHFTIFVVLTTTAAPSPPICPMLWFAFILLSLSYWQQRRRQDVCASFRCDLLSFYYLCRTDNNLFKEFIDFRLVVICFHFTIFVVLTTTGLIGYTHQTLLWFAFILLSLSYWQQLIIAIKSISNRCDLLSFYYLCRTDNNSPGITSLHIIVVICFHFTIFVVLTTTFLLKLG